MIPAFETPYGLPHGSPNNASTDDTERLCRSYAARDPRIRALISLAGMVHVQQFMQRHFGRLVPGRDLLLGKPGCPWTSALAGDAARIGSLTGLAARIRIPWLLVHGTADEMVPLADPLDARGLTAALQTILTIFWLASQGRVNRRGSPNPLQLAVLAETTMPATFVPGPPMAVQRMVIRMLAAVGRAVGYRTVYPGGGVVPE
jgi:hypothetical protein